MCLLLGGFSAFGSFASDGFSYAVGGWIRDGAFEQIPENDRKWSRHWNVSLAYTDWEGEPWQVKIDGEEFLLAYRGDWNGPIKRASAIRYRDWAGDKKLRTVVQLRR